MSFIIRVIDDASFNSAEGEFFMKVHILHTGNVLIDRALAYKEQTLHPAPFTGC